MGPEHSLANREDGADLPNETHPVGSVPMSAGRGPPPRDGLAWAPVQLMLVPCPYIPLL